MINLKLRRQHHEIGSIIFYVYENLNGDLRWQSAKVVGKGKGGWVTLAHHEKPEFTWKEQTIRMWSTSKKTALRRFIGRQLHWIACYLREHHDEEDIENIDTRIRRVISKMDSIKQARRIMRKS